MTTPPRGATPRPALTGDQVTLRAWEPADAPALAVSVAASQPELGAWLEFAAGAEPYTATDAEAFIARAAQRWHDGHSYAYAITLGDGQIAGCATLRDYGGSEMSIGYWLDSRRTGRGYATEAAGLLTQEALRCGADSVRIEHDQGNPASGAVAQRLGYRLVRQGPTHRPQTGSRTGIELTWRYPPLDLVEPGVG